jgi:hypothetical protein
MRTIIPMHFARQFEKLKSAQTLRVNIFGGSDGDDMEYLFHVMGTPSIGSLSSLNGLLNKFSKIKFELFFNVPTSVLKIPANVVYVSGSMPQTVEITSKIHPLLICGNVIKLTATDNCRISVFLRIGSMDTDTTIDPKITIGQKFETEKFQKFHIVDSAIVNTLPKYVIPTGNVGVTTWKP